MCTVSPTFCEDPCKATGRNEKGKWHFLVLLASATVSCQTSYCCPCLGTPGSCQLCGKYRGGLAPPGRQVLMQGCCWCEKQLRCQLCFLLAAWLICTSSVCASRAYKPSSWGKYKKSALILSVNFYQSICQLQRWVRHLKFTLEQKCCKATNVCSCDEQSCLWQGLSSLQYTVPWHFSIQVIA